MWYLIVVAVLVVALVFRLGLLSYAMYVVLGVLLLSRYLANEWAKGLSAERDLSRHEAEVGDRVVVNIRLKNSSFWLIPWVLVEDLLPRDAVMYNPPKLAVDGRRVQLVMLPGGKTRNLNYSFVCNRRGYFQVGPLTLETGDLFGLHRKYLISALPQYVLVLPKIIPLSGYNIASRRPIGEVRMSYRLYEDPTRISGVRPYEPGDPFNRVNWRATARTGVLHSKTYEPSTIAGATIVMDFHAAVHAAKDEPFRSELAVTAAASIANAVYLMGHQVGLISNGRDAADRIRTEGFAADARTRSQVRQMGAVKEKSDRLQPVVVPARRGAEQLARILESLARLELTDGLPLSALLLETTSRMVRDATVIVILPRVTAEETVALGMLKRQGFAVVALLNLYDEYDYAMAAGPLLALGIETRHLRDEAAVAEICGKQQGVAFV